MCTFPGSLHKVTHVDTFGLMTLFVVIIRVVLEPAALALGLSCSIIGLIK
jgi:hypothetical protein